MKVLERKVDDKKNKKTKNAHLNDTVIKSSAADLKAGGGGGGGWGCCGKGFEAAGGAGGAGGK